MAMSREEAEVIILDIHTPSEARILEDIQRRAWGTEEIVPYHIFIAASTVGGVVKGAYVNGKLVGYVFGFMGEFMGRRCLYSHQLAVIPEYQDKNIGYKLKMEQREEALRKGLDLIVWTYDPLQSKNAYLNINKLGCITRTYYINHYGEMNDELNRGAPSDRFMVEWWIKSKWVEHNWQNRIKYFEDFKHKDLVAIGLEANKEGEIILPNLKRETGVYVGIEIPSDINRLKKIDPNLGVKWRIATRRAFRHYIDKTYIVYRYLMYREKPWKGIYILKRGVDVNNFRDI